MADRKIYTEMVTGVINTDTKGVGITSTESEPKTLVAVTLKVSARHDNFVELWQEREKIVNVIDDNLPLTTDAVDVRFQLNCKIPVGQSIIPAVLSGAATENLFVTYEVDIGA